MAKKVDTKGLKKELPGEAKPKPTASQKKTYKLWTKKEGSDGKR